MNQSLMAIGAHADDIEFWAGGTCLKYHRAGYRIVYVMSTNNMSGGIKFVASGGKVVRHQATPETLMPIRKSECDTAAAVVGTKPIHLDHPQRHYTAPDLSKVEEGYGVPAPGGITHHYDGPRRRGIRSACGGFDS
jgi:LmbE family N-acetylglucosaminyl deacetylase